MQQQLGAAVTGSYELTEGGAGKLNLGLPGDESICAPETPLGTRHNGYRRPWRTDCVARALQAGLWNLHHLLPKLSCLPPSSPVCKGANRNFHLLF